jgi:arsenite methyltransferase
VVEGDVKAHVRATYGEAARRVSGGREQPGCGCSDRGADNGLAQRLYDAGDLVGQPPVAVAASLGCGNPAARAEMAPGEVVLDLGSGGGLDAFIAAKRVGSSGRVIGLDMTDEMLELARRNQEAAGVTNVEFLKGDIEAMPLPDASVDLVISNCVINLATDKQQVFREAFRVLRPGGRLAVSDMVFQGDLSLLPEGVRRSLDAWAGCVAGALEERDYRAGLAEAGFTQITLEADDGPPACEASACCGETTTAPSTSCGCSGDTGGEARPRGDATDGVRLVSGFIQARKPDTGP